MDAAVRDAYGELLGRQRWDWFGTFTFRPKHERATGGVHPEKADKAFRFLVSRINRYIYGPRWHRRPHTQLVWARGQEFHKSGRIHYHALFAGPDRDLNDSYRRMDVVDWWHQEFGIARVEVPACQDDVNRYVGKYAAKDGEVEFSPNFGRVRVQPLEFRFAGFPVPRHETGSARCSNARGSGPGGRRAQCVYVA